MFERRDKINKTKIEWTDYSLNPIKGKCKMGCSYCYARKIYDRFKWNPEVRFVREELDKEIKLKKPSKIFLCSTHELLGHWIPADWVIRILAVIRHSKHTYQILTKCPERAKYFNWPPNVWLGATVEKNLYLWRIRQLLRTNARTKFVSFEPLLSDMKDSINHSYQILSDFFKELDWIILGGQSGPKKFYPPEKWICEMELAADEAGIPIFEKPNLKRQWLKSPRQEFPENRQKFSEKKRG